MARTGGRMESYYLPHKGQCFLCQKHGVIVRIVSYPDKDGIHTLRRRTLCIGCERQVRLTMTKSRVFSGNGQGRGLGSLRRYKFGYATQIGAVSPRDINEHAKIVKLGGYNAKS